MRVKGAKARKDVVSLTIGKDIGINDISDHLSLALVGHLCGKINGEAAL